MSKDSTSQPLLSVVVDERQTGEWVGCVLVSLLGFLFVSLLESDLKLIPRYSTADVWSTITIPFSGFILTFRGRAYDGQRELDSRTNVQRIGFLMAERKVGSTSLSL